MKIFSHNLELSDQKLFKRKVAQLVLATVLFLPIIMIKHQLPALIYVSSLLVLHLYILWVYVRRGHPAAKIRLNRGFVSRLLAVLFFAYWLTVIRFQGTLASMVISLLLALTLHVCILLALMLRISRTAATLPKA
jgi:hypothetical protein